MHRLSEQIAEKTFEAIRGHSEGIISTRCHYNRMVTLTSFAHLRPQLLQRSLCPLGPRRHSGGTLVCQLAQSFCWSLPRLRFRFFFAAIKDWTSSASIRFLFSSCRISYCQELDFVVLSSSKRLSSEASEASWRPITSLIAWILQSCARPFHTFEVGQVVLHEKT